MSDVRMRELARRALQGDPEACERLNREWERVGNKRPHELIRDPRLDPRAGDVLARAPATPSRGGAEAPVEWPEAKPPPQSQDIVRVVEALAPSGMVFFNWTSIRVHGTYKAQQDADSWRRWAKRATVVKKAGVPVVEDAHVGS